LDEKLNYSKVNLTFRNYFIKGGFLPLHLFSESQTRLRLLYQDDSPIPKAVNAVRPLVYFEKTKRDRIPKILGFSRQHSYVAKWVRDDMIKRQKNKPKSLTDGFYEAVCAIVDGKSGLFQKKFEMHRAGFI
jgi:hypothetical protein